MRYEPHYNTVSRNSDLPVEIIVGLEYDESLEAFKEAIGIDPEEVRKFNRYKRLNEFIIEYKIDTWDQLYSHRDELIKRQTELTGRREELRRKQRRTKEKDPEIADLTAELWRIRKELRICAELEADIPKMQRAFEDEARREEKQRWYEEER